MTFLFIMLYIMFHLTVGGLVCAKVQAALKPACKYKGTLCDALCGHSFAAGLSVIAWPLTLPISAGLLMGQDKTARTEKKHQRQIDEARHKQELAKINAQTIAIQEREAGILR
jgi:hypothetical protein